jgi:uncharacterized protein (TIGR03435 family)
MPAAALSQIIAKAYDVWPDQISGPDWIHDRDAYAYSLAATMPANTTNDQFHAMMQNLLVERFHVRLHHVTQTRSGYELVVAQGGPKINEWSPPNPGAAAKRGIDTKGFPKLDPGFGPGTAMVISGSSGMAPIRMTRRESMAMFCLELGASINVSQGTPFDEVPPRVVDKTGLVGIYEFNLEFAGLIRPAGRLPAPEGEPGTAAASDPAPNIFTALEKQLGLQLRKLKNVPVDVLVIDYADKVPTEN